MSLSLVFFVVSVLLGGINYITTVLNMRTKGMSMFRLPLTIWAFLVTAILGLLSFPVLASGFFMVMFDRTLGTSFFLNEIYIAGEALTDKVGAVAALSVLLVGSCSGSQEQAPATPAPSPAGEPITVPVRADTPIRVDVPGVGTLSGEPGSVSGPGKLVVQPMRGQPALPAGVRVTGPGVDVSFDGTTLAKPLTLTFGTSEGKCQDCW